MVRPWEMLDMLDVPPPLRMQPTPSRVNCYMNWGFTIYRTHYSPQSDKHWEVLLDCLNRQMTLALGYFRDQEWEDEVLWQKADHYLAKDCCKSREEYLGYLNKLDDLFYLDTREDPSLDGLDVRGIREVCCDDPPETEQGMAGFLSRYVLLADRGVFEDMEKGEYIIKVVAYDWEDGGDNWGWMRIPTGYLLDFWHALLRNRDYPHSIIRFDGPEEDLDEYVWPGSMELLDTGACSEIRDYIHYEGQRTWFKLDKSENNDLETMTWRNRRGW